jgi:uncharacterized protein (TIGR00297 family)
VAEWRKVIPESRDRLQSKVLVWVVGPVLIAPLPVIALMSMHPPRSSVMAVKALGISLTFGVLVWALRAATPMAAFLGSAICFLVIMGTGYTNRSAFHSALAPLGTLFVLTFAATKAGRRRKVQLGVAEGKRGRNAAQIVANLGAAGLVIVGGFFGIFDRLCCQGGGGFWMLAIPIGVLAALCEATADTVSSEMGQAFGGTPVMLTTFRRVEAGTDGAVTVFGTTAGIVATAVVAVIGMWAMRLSGHAAVAGFMAGVAGLFFDSMLGATVEQKGWLGNDLVNFSSTIFAVVVAMGLAVAF